MPYQSLIICVMIIVIADDITGAAEIAGAALRYKLNTMLTIGYADVPQSTQVWVIATDTRSVSRADAVNTVNGIIGRLDKKDNILFKKTDSVLRGHVAAELNAMLKGMRYSKALLIPQNPSRGRIIRDGIYYINGEPVDKTQFRHDPEFPITTSEVRNILGVEVNVHNEQSGSRKNSRRSRCGSYFCRYGVHRKSKTAGRHGYRSITARTISCINATLAGVIVEFSMIRTPNL